MGNSLADHQEDIFAPLRPSSFHGSQRPNDKRPSDPHRPIGGGGLDRPFDSRPTSSFEIERPHSDGNDSPIIIFTDDDRKPLRRPTRIPNPIDNDFHPFFSESPYSPFLEPENSPPFHDDDRRPIFQNRPNRPSVPFKPDHNIHRPDFIFEDDPIIYKPPKRPSKPGRPQKPFHPGPVKHHDSRPSRHPQLDDEPHERGNYLVCLV